jgi:hypothetical protein
VCVGGETKPVGNSPTAQSLCPKVKLQIPPLRYPGFPVELGGVGELHAAFPTESRTRGGWWVPRNRKSRCASVGMTKWRVALHLGSGGEGWTEHSSNQPAFGLPAFSSTHSASCAIQKAVRPLIWTALTLSRPCETAPRRMLAQNACPGDSYASQEKRNSLVRSSLMVSRSLAAFSNSNFLAASRMSDSSLPM